MSNLLEFISGPRRNEWIDEPGITYYVRKNIRYPEVIELANVEGLGPVSQFGFWRFIRRYEYKIPFLVEQVINPRVAEFFRSKRWHERPSLYSDLAAFFVSPLAVERYSDDRIFKKLYMDEIRSDS